MSILTAAPSLVPPLAPQSDASERIYPAIVDNMRDGVLAFDGEGRIMAINPPARDVLRLEEVNWIGKSFAGEVIGRPELGGVNDAIIDAMYAPNNVVTREVTLGTGAGERHLVVRTSMLRDEVETRGVVAIISDVSEQVRALRERVEFGRLTVLFIVTMALANIVTVLVDRYLDVDVYAPAFSWAYLAMIALPVFGTVALQGFSARSIGLSFDNWRRAAIEGVAVSALLILLMAVAVRFARPELMEKGFGAYVELGGLATIVLLYAPHSFIQEVLARGVLQNALRRMLNDELGLRSIVVASTVFGVFHGHYGLTAMGVTMISGMIFGWLALRHGNLIGATIAHVLAGTAAFAFGFV